MVSHALGFFHDDCGDSARLQWPDLPARLVRLGGVTVTYAQASAALPVLAAASGVAVASVLKAARSPLADCDYRAAAAPFLGTGPAGSGGPWGRGAAGRPVTRQAFMAAISAALAAARDAEPARHYAVTVHAARAAFASDSGYAAAMAKAAVTAAQREHAAALRAFLDEGVRRATASCAASQGQFTCTVTAACGTGQCRFAAGVLASFDVPAGRGRIPRPASHVPGGGFSTAAALAALESAVPYVAGVRVSSGDCAVALDTVPG